MAREIFTWSGMRQKGAAGKIKFNVRKAKFGDGYEQRVGDGINNKQQSWPLVFEGNEATLAPIKNFIDRHGGVRSFHWTPPGSDKAGVYVVEGYSYVSVGGGLYSLSADFIEVFAP